IRDALHAGTRQARAATTNMDAATDAKIAGSSGRVQEHRLDYAYRPDAGDQANRQSIERWTQAVAQHQAQNILALCTERHANADLSSALRREVRKHSVQPY